MPLDWTSDLETVDWAELSELYRIAPLGVKPPDLLERVFRHSLYRWFVRDAGRLVAAGRALADGADCSYICDIAVHPDHQGTGLGRAITQRLVDDSAGYRKIILYAVPTKVGFYRKLGFRRMTTAMAIFADQATATAKGYLTDD